MTFAVLGTPLFTMENGGHLRLCAVMLEAGRSGGIVIRGGEFLQLHPMVSFDAVKLERNLVGDRVLVTGSPTGENRSRTYLQGDAALTPLCEEAGNILTEDDPGFVDMAGERRWELLFESSVLRLGQTLEVDVDVTGAERLRLKTTDGGDGILGDVAVWADARIR